MHTKILIGISLGFLVACSGNENFFRKPALDKNPVLWPKGIRVEALTQEEKARFQHTITPTLPSSRVAIQQTFSLPSKTTKHPIEDVCRKWEKQSVCASYAMDTFYQALYQTASGQKGALTRITHLGDSIVGSDYVSTTVKRRLQNQFGDGGRGFVFIGKPRFYYLSDLSHYATGWIKKSVVSSSLRERRFGIGGAAFLSSGPGASATFFLQNKNTFAHKVSKITIYYLAEPKGGQLELVVDGVLQQTLNTTGETSAEVASISIPAGAKKFQIRVIKGRVRLFGLALEADGPGVIYDAIGLLGNTAYAMLRVEKEFWKEQILLRNPNLIILHLGANETGIIKNSSKVLAKYIEAKTELVNRIRTAVPNASCLLYGPMDGLRTAFASLAKVQREIAKNTGCAFWDARAFMGGQGSAKHWIKKGLLAKDGVHPTPKGARVLGSALEIALEQGFSIYIDSQRNKH